MPKTKLICACVDHANHRTEYQKLTNILVDEERTIGDVVVEHDTDHNLLDKVRTAHNKTADLVDNLYDIIRLLVNLLDGVLTEEEYKKLKEILKEKGNKD